MKQRSREVIDVTSKPVHNTRTVGDCVTGDVYVHLVKLPYDTFGNVFSLVLSNNVSLRKWPLFSMPYAYIDFLAECIPVNRAFDRINSIDDFEGELKSIVGKLS